MTIRDRTNAFASCPAATGEAECPHFPDGAHRCSLDRDHPTAPSLGTPTTERIAHHCTCRYIWTCLTGTLTDQTVIPMRRI